MSIIIAAATTVTALLLTIVVVVSSAHVVNAQAAGTTTTTAEVSLIKGSGSGEFMAMIGIIGGSSLFALGLVALCCRWLIKFTSVEQREMRRKKEFETLQREQERLMKALLEMNTTEEATQRRAAREKQKLEEKMTKQEDIRIKNERVKAKKLKELQYELRKQGTDLVLDGFDDDDDDLDAPGADDKKGGGPTVVNEEEAKARALKDAAVADEQRKIDAEFARDLDDADEGEAIMILPPKQYNNDKDFFAKVSVHEAAKAGRLVPNTTQSSYRKPWEAQEPKKQKFVTTPAVRKVIPPNAEDCPKPPVVVYDDEKDDFVYISHEDHQRRLAEERMAAAASSAARERDDRNQKKGAKSTDQPNFDEVDGGDDKGPASDLPPISEAWTANKNEVPLARAHTAVRSSKDVKLEKARWSFGDPDSF